MNLLKYVAWALLGVVLFFLVWGLIEPRLIDIERETVEIPNLPPAWEGRQVAQISDWQLGIVLDNESTIRRVVNRIIELRPELVLITGDFVYHPEAGEVRKAVDLARPLVDAGLPTYAVLGNHDYKMKQPDGTPDSLFALHVRRTLEEAGVDVLHNEAVALSLPGQPNSLVTEAQASPPLYLVGLGPSWPEEAHAAVALSGVPESAPRLIMMHNPNAFDQLPSRAAPLAVAGHTHGGQVRLPLLPAWSWLTFMKEDEVHADGWIREYGAPGNLLYVNRGIGMGVVPIRINCMPELTLFTLLRSNTRAGS